MRKTTREKRKEKREKRKEKREKRTTKYSAHAKVHFATAIKTPIKKT